MTGIRLAAVFAFFAGVVFGQNAELSGLIQDPSDSGVSGAAVTIRNEQTGGRRNTSSNASGFYSLPALGPGLYRLSIRAVGFETIVREGIKLEVGDTARIDFSLRIGDSRTGVTVHGDPPLINSEDASVGTVIDRDTIDKMPLNGRGIQALIELSPGVVAVPVTTGDRGQFAINGQRNDANYFTVDGVSANFALMGPLSLAAGTTIPTPLQGGGAMIPANNFVGTFSNLVSPDALQEFRIQTSTFAPEFGRSPGAQIGLVTRSGTNRYSGSLFEYFRNDKTDANDWFANQEALPKPPLRFNDFGGSLGGPVRIPHLYDGHERTFFFLSVEDLVMIQPQPPVSFLVPTLEARQNAPPLLAALLSAYPLPNRSSSQIGYTDFTGFSGYAGSGSLRQDQQTWGLRLDHVFNDKFMSFVRYNRAPSSRIAPEAGPSNTVSFSLETETLTIGLTQALSPKLINEIRLNGSGQFDAMQSRINSTGGAQRPPDSPFFPPGYSSNDSQIGFFISPSPALSIGFGGRDGSRQLQIVDNLSWSSGAHQFKAGTDYRWFSPVTTDPRFTSLLIFPSLYDPSGAYTGTVPIDFTILVGIPRTAFVVEAFSAYVQDTWKARRGLTLTYGLRWEIDPAPRVSAGQAAVFSGITNPADLSTVNYVPSGKPFYATSWSNFAPRLGIGWQIHDGAARKTVLRIGAGRFFDLGQGGFESNGYHAPTVGGYTNQPLGSPTGGTPAAPFTLPLVGIGGSVGAAHGYNLPYTWQWNATIEQSIGQQTFSAGYVGALGRRLIGWIVAPGNDFVMNNDSSSSYNAMQLQFNRRLSSRLHVLVSYTWSHSIDDLSQDIPYQDNGNYSLPFDPRAWGSSDFDVRHSLNGSIIAALPSPHGGIAGLLFRNWTANSIFFARSALPTDLIMPSLSSDNVFIYSGNRPNVVPGQPLYLYGSQFPGGKSFNGAAFSMPPNGLDGDLGRNVLRGLGAWQIDLSLHREFRVSEGLSLQLRAEAFNIFNHPNFANPSDTYNRDNTGQLTFYPPPGPGFGSATQTLANGLGPSNVLGQLSSLFQVGGPRTMQFALRLRF
jgi:Carboxypeptidase regulatory-like domain